MVRLGLFDEAAHKVGLDEIRPDDIFVCSYPKSGNTWVRFLMANMLEDEQEITFKNVNQYVPGIYTQREAINKMEGGRFIKTHDPFYQCFPKVIYIFRDYRDVLISYYHFQQSQNWFDGTLKEFVDYIKIEKPFGTWKEHVQNALDHCKKYEQQTLMLSYEDLIADPLKQVRRIEEFCEISSKRPLEEVVKICQFSSLQNNEEKHGNLAGDTSRKFFRTGRSEQWRSEIDEELHEYILQEPGIRDLLTKLKYKID